MAITHVATKISAQSAGRGTLGGGRNNPSPTSQQHQAVLYLRFMCEEGLILESNMQIQIRFIFGVGPTFGENGLYVYVHCVPMFIKY